MAYNATYTIAPQNVPSFGNGQTLLINYGQGLINIAMNSGNQDELKKHIALIQAAPKLERILQVALTQTCFNAKEQPNWAEDARAILAECWPLK